jgi:hypothetical protein
MYIVLIVGLVMVAFDLGGLTSFKLGDVSITGPSGIVLIIATLLIIYYFRKRDD